MLFFLEPYSLSKIHIFDSFFSSLTMIDTHSHLWFKHFDEDREEVIQRARDAGVHTMVQVGCEEKSSADAVQMADKYEFMYATVGLHPTDSEAWNDGKALEWMKKLIGSSQKIVAIGETGIDYYHSADSAEIQKVMLKEQCLLAQEHDLPVIVHLRMNKRPVEGEDGLNQAEHDCLEVLDAVKMAADKVIFHCFSGSLLMAREVVKRGWLISFSGVVTYPNAGELRDVAAEIPLEQIVVETDCPFLPPQAYRGERNEPSYVIETAQVVADARGIALEELEKAIDDNAKRVLGV